MKIRRVAAFCGGFIIAGMTQCLQSMETYTLSESDFQKGSAFIDRNQYYKFPRSLGGRTAVFLPENLPIVLKRSGCKSDNRLTQMEMARKLCNTLGITHLIIPEARKHGNFLIEDRLPLMGVGYLEQMGLYVQNKEKFTHAIRELAAFLCRAELGDLWMGHDAIFLYGSVPSDVARFDNLPLYIEKEEGKIGLIDLEHLKIPQSYSLWSDSKRRENVGNCREATADSDWRMLITMFPYHFKDILDVVQKMHQWINFDKKYMDLLEEQRDRAIQTYEIGYIGHQKFLKQHGVDRQLPVYDLFNCNTASKIPKISKQKQEEIKASLKVFLEEWYNYDANEDRWNENHRPLTTKEREEMENLVDRTVPVTISLIRLELSEKISICKESKEDLVQCRSIKFNPYTAENYLYSEFRMEERNHGNYADKMIHFLLTQMNKANALYHYQPGIIRV